MITNTYTPIVGGVERSINSFSGVLKKKGHEVIIVAPSFENMPENEEGVIRVAAIEKFNHTDFSVNLPVPGLLDKLVKRFKPDIVHSHHPFAMGDIALRLSGQYSIPLIFTYHTMYEHYIHYLPVHNQLIRRFVTELSAGYANLVNRVIVPSRSVKDVLHGRGVHVPIEVIPTGIDIRKFKKGNRNNIRQKLHIDKNAFVIGHVGRLAEEKNLEYLARGISILLKKEKDSHFMVVGEGELKKKMKRVFIQSGVDGRVHFTGILEKQDLVDSYHAMDIFAFTSRSETQGVVLAEAMACGTPVVAIDAQGVRDIVKDRVNGRLIHCETKIIQENNKLIARKESSGDVSVFVSALMWCKNQSQVEFKKLERSAQKTSQEYSSELCTERLLDIYNKTLMQRVNIRDIKNSPWQQTMKRIKTEWHMARNFIDASEAAMSETALNVKNIKKSKIRKWIVRIKRGLNKHEWSAHILKLSVSEGDESQRGLVLIQIDGFSRFQFQEAINNSRMPFLKGLLSEQRYANYSFYTGLPSSTPSVQGELFYGVKQSVPAFSYFDQKMQRVLTMYDGASAIEIQNRLELEGNECLLEGGSSYSNVFSGGAKESHFCASSLGWSRIWRTVSFGRIIVIVCTHFLSLLRMSFLVLLEIILGTIDFMRGLLEGKNFLKEFKFVPTRAIICILLRDFIALGVKIDIARGLPVIHLNLLGYDEQAHRRGPSSLFAHKALKGIDLTIASIYKNANLSTRRNYDVWIYSDHGQEDVLSYMVEHGQSVQESVKEVYRRLYLNDFDSSIHHGSSQNAKSEVFDEEIHRCGVQFHRANYLGSLAMKPMQKFKYDQREDVIVTAIGPTGNVYCSKDLDEDQKNHFAHRLVSEARIPFVFLAQKHGGVKFWCSKGEFMLPEDADVVFGSKHVFIKDLTRDLIDLCHHPESGIFTFAGWRPDQKPISFPIENGAHAGFGAEETNPFLLIPSDIFSYAEDNQSYVTTAQLRREALRFLDRLKEAPLERVVFAQPKISKIKKIRIMTYNVHSCVGMDAKVSPERIARVIGRHEPDVVALQELDLKRPRTNKADQTQIIAQQLEMIYHFHPNIRVEEEMYGNAILSRYPMKMMYAGRLPVFPGKPGWEPRGAVWVNIMIDDQRIQVINTHLGLRPRERIRQVQALMGEDWLSHSSCDGPVILCGDFNALPNSPSYNCVSQGLRDVQVDLNGHQPRPTWFSHYPVGRIDHVFVSDEINVKSIHVSRTGLDKKSSDHLPLIVDLEILKK